MSKWVKKKFSAHPLENKYFIAVPAPYTYMVYMEKKYFDCAMRENKYLPGRNAKKMYLLRKK